MAGNNLFFRLLFYPISVFRGLHQLGVDGSRDFNNRRRFPDSLIDHGVCIDHNSKIAPNVHVLEHSIINQSSINSYSYVGKHCIIQNSSIGKFCSIASDVGIGLGAHPIDLFSTSPLFYRKKNILNINLVEHDLEFEEYKPIKISHDVWIGTKALIMDGVSVGTGAIIAANSVVTKDVPPYAIVGGSPAKIIRYRFDESKITYLLKSNWWDMDLIEIKKKLVDSEI